MHPQKEAIRVFRDNSRFALPVTNDSGVLLGVVTLDDVLRLAEKENTREIQKIGGSEALDEPYTSISFINLMRKRAGWLIILFFGEMLTATAMGHFQDEIARALVLSLFLPLIISSGGNSGSQASSIIIRSMALGEIGFRSWFYVVRKEFASGLVLGSVLGMVGFLRITVWQLLHIQDYGNDWILIALTVMLALIGVVLWGTLSGSMLPLILKRLGADPAASSAPFVATLVDVTGLIIYFSVALLVLRGTILKPESRGHSSRLEYGHRTAGLAIHDALGHGAQTLGDFQVGRFPDWQIPASFDYDALVLERQGFQAANPPKENLLGSRSFVPQDNILGYRFQVGGDQHIRPNRDNGINRTMNRHPFSPIDFPIGLPQCFSEFLFLQDKFTV
jgi:cation transporter-like permease